MSSTCACTRSNCAAVLRRINESQPASSLVETLSERTPCSKANFSTLGSIPNTPIEPVIVSGCATILLALALIQ